MIELFSVSELFSMLLTLVVSGFIGFFVGDIVGKRKVEKIREGEMI